jgi:hypothetical protein
MYKKSFIIASIITFFYQVKNALAATDPKEVFGTIDPPDAVSRIGYGNIGLNTFLSNIVTLIYMVAGIIFLFMFFIAGFTWLTAGGDKEKVGAAQKRMTNAVIGIVILAVAFLIARVIGQITGFEFYVGQNG